MTERTVAQQTQLEDDAISLTSTQGSEYDPDKEFNVVRILAEKLQNGKKLFLIQWENYPIERSTWEPKDHISPEIHEAWKERKQREKRGIEEAFDVPSFQQTLRRLAKEKQARQKLRKAKRKRLGIPVPSSDSDTRMADRDNSSSDEAVEENAIEDTTPRAPKRKSESPSKQTKKPARYRVQGNRAHRIDDSSDASGVELLRNGSLQKPRHENSPSSSKVQVEKVKSTETPKNTRPSSASSSDVPLSQESQQRLPVQEPSQQARPDLTQLGLERPIFGRSDSGRNDPKQKDPERPRSSSDASGTLQQSKSGAPPVVPAMSSEQTSLFMNEDSPTDLEKRARGRPPTRGKSATRGGASVTPRNVFEAGDDAKKVKGRKPGTNLLKISMDTSKNPKKATNMHTLRKLELQARDVAERAPDLSALGGLYNPSDMSSFKPVRPSTLRRTSSSAPATRDQNDPGEEADLDDLLEEQPAAPTMQPPPPVARQSTYQGAPICFFWDRSQLDKRNGDCANGYMCKYLHEYRTGAPLAPPPPNYVEPPPISSNPTGHTSQHNKSTCFFWDRARQDPRHTGCDKGDSCTYLHAYEMGAPIAAPPPGYADIFSKPSSTGDGSSSRSPWQKDPVPTDRSLPSSLNRDQPVPSSTTTFGQPRGQLPQNSTTSSPSKHQVAPNRPLWDPYRPLHAICYFYHTQGNCNPRGRSCKYAHSNEAYLPIAPPPLEQRAIQARVVCRDWASGGCSFSSKECFYLHAYVPNPSQSDQNSSSAGNKAVNPEPSKPETSAVPVSAEPRKKSVKFAVDDNDEIIAEPKIISPVRAIPNAPLQDRQRAVNRRICHFWELGSCRFGSFCRDQHGYDRDERDIPQEVRMQDRGEEQKSARPVNPNLAPIGSRTALRIPRAEEQVDAGFEPMLGIEFDNPSSPAEVTPIAVSVPVVNDAVKSALAVKGPQKKVTMAEYKRRSELKKLGSRAKHVTFGQDEVQVVTLDFGDIQNVEDSPWKLEFATLDKITFGQICMAQDFEAQQGFIQKRALFAGNLVPADAGNQDVVKVIDKVGDELVLRSAGLISLLPSFAILLFPASKSEWKYLETSADFPKDSRLRYFVFQTSFDIDRPHGSEPATIKLGEPYRRMMAEKVHGLNIKHLLPQVKDSHNPYKFYMLFPSVARHTYSFLAAWIKECNPHSRIYDSQKEGSWEFFRGSVEVGVVLIHETAVENIHRIPHLFEVVARKSTFTFWCISDGDSPYPMFPSKQLFIDESSMGRVTATRLFPQGCAMLLTPSFLVAEPQKAASFMNLFLLKLNSAVPGSWKLVCASNISQYLMDLAISKALEKEAFETEHRDNPAKDAMLNDAGLSFTHCEAWNKLHSKFVNLDQKGLLDSPVASDDSETEYHFHEERESPIVLADRSVDPDDEQALVEWFAAWSMRNLDIHKRFVVIGTGSSSSRRAKRKKEVALGSVEVEDESEALPEILGPEFAIGSSKPPALNFRSFAFTKKGKSMPSGGRQSSAQKEQKQTALSPNNKSNQSQTPDNSNMTSPPPTNATNHGIDDSLPEKHLRFCAITSGSASDAATYLERANDDLRRAIDMYEKERGDQAMDLHADAQVQELIASHGERAPLRFATADQDLARARQMYDSPTSFVPNMSTSYTPGSARLPQYDGADDGYFPQFTQYDGADDRPGSSSSTSTTRSGIATGENGKRFVPRSVRADKSVRKEIPVRPGFIPTEDVERYVSPGVAASRSASRTASVINSPSPVVNSPGAAALGMNSPTPRARDPNAMEVDSGAEAASGEDKEDTDTGTGNGTDGEKDKPKKKKVAKKEVKEYTYEATTSWYERYKKTNGGGWEHIFVGSHDEAIKKSGVGSGTSGITHK
ncbi:uncharacterized protein PAC_03523 [Phialocephala subalpina]|uniref:Chromo domain-containing protein n=1 Tax=Phialocephala subalpina TaxID=576137 RepID=A0A1L7WLL2_9HELO|nr:uncharacterized protein PAC_03523 [Phialocephala subalpina]